MVALAPLKIVPLNRSPAGCITRSFGNMQRTRNMQCARRVLPPLAARSGSASRLLRHTSQDSPLGRRSYTSAGFVRIASAESHQWSQPHIAGSRSYVSGSQVPTALRPAADTRQSGSAMRPLRAITTEGLPGGCRDIYTWSPPVLRPPRPSSEPGSICAQCVGPAAIAASTLTDLPTQKDSVQLLFDSILNCYFDPKTNKYFELR